MLTLSSPGPQITKVVIPPPKDGKARDYAFVHFADAAVVAKLIEDCERGEKPQLEGTPLEVSALAACLTWPDLLCGSRHS